VLLGKKGSVIPLSVLRESTGAHCAYEIFKRVTVLAEQHES
jgi:hypothetical protein